MQFLDGAAVAGRALWSNKLRSALTMLGNIVGVTSVIAVVSLISGMDARVRDVIAAEGSNLVTVSRRNEIQALSNIDAYLQSLRNPRLGMSDYRHLVAWLPARHQVAARMAAAASVDHRGERLEDVAVEGWTANVAEVRTIRLEAGRLFTPVEVDRSHPVCVIGADVVDNLFGDRPALAAFVRIGGRHARVIGILEREPGFLGQSPNRRVLIPLTLFTKAVSSRPSLTLSIRAPTAEEIPEVIDAVTAAMRVQHRLRPDEEDDFAVMTSEMLLDLWGRITGSIFAALVGLVSVSLIVGGIVIMNTMLVSVTERTREVGLRKALGARRRDITWQFLCEALALSTSGGVIGILLGFSLARAVSMWTPLPYAVEAWSVFAGLGVTAGVGLVFGIYPASRAARLSPVEALRFE